MGELKRHKSIPEALQYVADHPLPATDDTLQLPAWELVSRRLFELANRPGNASRGGAAKMLRAQKMIFNRMVGRRRPGTHPAQVGGDEIDILDLTQGVLG